MYVTYPVDVSTAHRALVLWRMNPWRAPADLEGPVQGIISGVNLTQLAAATVTIGDVDGAMVETAANCIYFEPPSVGVTGRRDVVVSSGQLTLKLAGHIVGLPPL